MIKNPFIAGKKDHPRMGFDTPKEALEFVIAKGYDVIHHTTLQSIKTYLNIRDWEEFRRVYKEALEVPVVPPEGVPVALPVVPE